MKFKFALASKVQVEVNRKKYTCPHLTVLGDLRSLTLSGTASKGENNGHPERMA